MSAQISHEEIQAHEIGVSEGRGITEYMMAGEMLVLFCALITAHKRRDEDAFFSTVEIAKKTLGSYRKFSPEDWAVFRGDRRR